MRIRLLLVFLFGVFLSPAWAQDISRNEILAVAREYAEYKWEATAKNSLHANDKKGIPVNTPDGAGDGLWTIGQGNIGMPYKWGGFDSLASFDAGVKKGKAAGDLYSSWKRKVGDKGVSGDAVGIDCSGFISRCWKLSSKHGTSTLPGICKKLADSSHLKPGDIMNAAGSHVILFARWVNAEKTRGLFYEADPSCKVRASEYLAKDLEDSGFKPLRYKKVKD